MIIIAKRHNHIHKLWLLNRIQSLRDWSFACGRTDFFFRNCMHRIRCRYINAFNMIVARTLYLVERQSCHLFTHEIVENIKISHEPTAIWYLLSFGWSKLLRLPHHMFQRVALHSLFATKPCVRRVCLSYCAIERCANEWFLRFYGFQFSLIKPAASAICSRMFYCYSSTMFNTTNIVNFIIIFSAIYFFFLFLWN